VSDNPGISSLPVDFTMRSRFETIVVPNTVVSAINGEVLPAVPVPTASAAPATLEALLSSSFSTISDPNALISAPIKVQPDPERSRSVSQAQPLVGQTSHESAPAARDRAPSVSSNPTMSSELSSSTQIDATQVTDSQLQRRQSVSAASVDPIPATGIKSAEANADAQRSRSPSIATSPPTPQPPTASLRSQSVSSFEDRAKTLGSGFHFSSLIKQEQQSAANLDKRATWHEPAESAPNPESTDATLTSPPLSRDRSKSLSSSKSADNITENKPADPVEPPPAHKPSAFDKIADAPMNPMELAMKTLQEQSGASLVMASPAALIAKQAELQQSRPKTLQEMSETEINHIYEEVLKEMEQEEEILAEILKQKELLEQQIRDEEKREEDQFKAEKSRLEKEISESDTMIEKYMTRVAQLDKELREKELECDEENWKLYMSRESHLEHQYLQSSLTKELESFREELEAREESIRRVQQAMDVARISQKKTKTSVRTCCRQMRLSSPHPLRPQLARERASPFIRAKANLDREG
jgi:hypothetical protein